MINEILGARYCFRRFIFSLLKSLIFELSFQKGVFRDKQEGQIKSECDLCPQQ